MSVVAFIRRLLEAGFEWDQALTAADAFEAEAPEAEQPMTARQARNRRYYESKRLKESENKTVKTSKTLSDGSDAPSPRKEVSPAPLQETQPHPAPPLPPKGGSQPPRFQPSKSELDGIWSITPRLGRERSSRRDLERSLTAAMRRGHEPEPIRQALLRAYASPSFSGDHAKGVHRLIENDRWQSFAPETETAPGPPRPKTPEEEAASAAAWEAYYDRLAAEKGEAHV